jgi:hypothetical protein
MACPEVAGAAALLYDTLSITRSVENATIVRGAIETCANPILLDYFRYGRLDLGASMAAIRALKRPVVLDAWWTSTTDNDGDGYKRTATLNWETNVSGAAGQLTVFEKVYWRVHGTTSWTFLTATSPRQTYGANPDPQSVTLSSMAHNQYDFRIVVYRSGVTAPDVIYDNASDTDLDGYKFELPSEDVSMHATIADASWTSDVDQDGDGYKRSATLTWNPDVVSAQGSMMVYEKVYWRPHGTGSWTYYTKTNAHTIAGQATNDTQSVAAPTLAHGEYDFRIVILRNGETAADYIRDSANDNDLNTYKLETVAQDWRVIVADAWWSNVVDSDGDGYKRSARLIWDPNVAGSDASVSVFEKVYWRVHGTTTWNFQGMTTAHPVSGTGVGDARYIDIPGKANNRYDFRVVVLRDGTTTADDIRDSSNDSDLSNVAFELPSQDVSGATIGDVWWTDAVDNDSDGHSRSARLHWNPDVGGAGSLTVFEKVYWRVHGTTAWTFLTATSPHVISGATSEDAQYVDVGGRDHNAYDYRVIILREGQTTPDFIADSANRLSVSGVLMEMPSQD